MLVLMVLTETTRQAKAGAKIVTAGAAGETSFMVVVVVVVGVLVLRVSNETKEKADAKIMTRGGLVRPGSLFWF